MTRPSYRLDQSDTNPQEIASQEIGSNRPAPGNMLSLSWGPRLQNSSTTVARQAPQSSGPTMESRVRCSLCAVNFTSRTHADSHYNGRKHRKNLRSPARNPRGPRLTKPDVARPEDTDAGHGFFCEVCGKNFSGPAPMRQHMQSLLHERRVRALQGSSSQTTRDELPAPPGRGPKSPPRSFIGGEDSAGGRRSSGKTEQAVREALIQLCKERLQREIAWVIPFVAASVVDAVLDKIADNDGDRAATKDDSDESQSASSQEPDEPAGFAFSQDGDDTCDRSAVDDGRDRQPAAKSPSNSNGDQRSDGPDEAEPKPAGEPRQDDAVPRRTSGDETPPLEGSRLAAYRVHGHRQCEQVAGLANRVGRLDLRTPNADNDNNAVDGEKNPDGTLVPVSGVIWPLESVGRSTGLQDETWGTGGEDLRRPHFGRTSSLDLIDFSSLNGAKTMTAARSPNDDDRWGTWNNNMASYGVTTDSEVDVESLQGDLVRGTGTDASRCDMPCGSVSSPSLETHLLDVVGEIIQELDFQTADTAPHFEAPGQSNTAL